MEFTKRKTKSIITESASAADEATRSRFSSLYAFWISEEDVGGVHVGAILVIMTAGIDESGFAGTSMADHGVGLLEQAEANGVLLHNGRVGIEHHQIDLSLLVVLANSFGDGPFIDFRICDVFKLLVLAELNLQSPEKAKAREIMGFK